MIGTHALIQDTVEFDDLGLVVVDEQHRFGVEQRDALRAKADRPPHTLVMTATPIPRTVAMTVFGDLDVSTLTELPLGRAPIVTHVVPAGEKPHFLDRTWERVREEAAKGHQAYVVCPRIGGDPADPSADEEEDEDVPYLRLVPDEPEPTPRKVNRPPAVAVLELADLLRDGPLAGLRVSVLHGRMPAEEKDEVMRLFTAGEIDVLVATTVIEVGVDVANATVMVVMDADRFGVSQLHQLRGRIGRGEAPGLCLLVTDVPDGAPARERLDAVAATLDGFELSRVDLTQRREGDVLGRLAVRPPVQPPAAARDPRRGRDRHGPGRGGGAARRGPPAGPPRRAAGGGGRPRRRRSAPTTSRRPDRVSRSTHHAARPGGPGQHE